MKKQPGEDKSPPLIKRPKQELNSLLIAAAKKLDAERVAELIAAGANVNVKINGRALLWEVCDAYDSLPVDKIVKLLLENGANPKVGKKDLDGPLHYAAMYGQVEAAKLLVLHGANVNAKGSYGRTALIYAASDGNSPELVKFLLDHGASVNAKNQSGENALFEHITRGKESLEIVELLLDNGISANSKTKHYGSVLHWAAFCGRTEVIALLVKRGAKVNAKDNMDQRPVQKAMSQNKLETVKLLFKLGADPQTKGTMGFSLLEFAANSGDKEFVREIISKIRKEEKNGLNALTAASRKGNLEMVKLLVEEGFDIDECNSYGRETPLMKAAYYGKTEVVTYLLENGADIHATDYKGHTALLNAAYNGHNEVVEELLKKGAKINERNNYNWNALMQACFEGHYETAKLLLEKGSPTDEIDKERGATALSLAKHFGHKKVISLLESYGAKEREIKMRKKDEPYFSLFECDICEYLPDKKELGRTLQPDKFEGLEVIFEEIDHSDRYCDDTRRIMKCKNCGTYYYHYHTIDTEDAFVTGPYVSQNFMRLNLIWLKEVLNTIEKQEPLKELNKRYPDLINECLMMLKKKPDSILSYHLNFVIESLTDYYIKKNDWKSLKAELLQHNNASFIFHTVKDLLLMYGETAYKTDFPRYTHGRSVLPEYREQIRSFLGKHNKELKKCIDIFKNSKDEKIRHMHKSVMEYEKYYKVF